MKPAPAAINAWAASRMAAEASRAPSKSGAEADDLYRQAGEKYRHALKIKPDFYAALRNWARSLLMQSKLHEGKQARRFLAQAYAKLEKANRLQPDSESYNFACASALLGDVDQCRKWLKDCERCGRLPSAQHLLTDADLESVRNMNWFTELVERPKSASSAPSLLEVTWPARPRPAIQRRLSRWARFLIPRRRGPETSRPPARRSDRLRWP